MSAKTQPRLNSLSGIAVLLVELVKKTKLGRYRAQCLDGSTVDVRIGKGLMAQLAEASAKKAKRKKRK